MMKKINRNNKKKNKKKCEKIDQKTLENEKYNKTMENLFRDLSRK